MSAVVLSPGFDTLVDAALLLAAVALVLEECDVMGGKGMDNDGKPDSFWNILELMFCLFFLIEMVLKLGVLGLKAYCRSLKSEPPSLQPTPEDPRALS